MANNIAKNAVERTSGDLLAKVFPHFGKVAWDAAGAVFSAVVARRRAAPLRLALLKGRKGLPDAETALFDAIVREVGGNGILAHDRGSTAKGSSPTQSGRATGPSCA